MSWERAIERAWIRMRHAIGFAQVTAPMDERGVVSQGQIRLFAAQTRDRTPHLQLFGFVSVLPVGTDVVTVAHGGDPSSTVIIASGHQTYRLKGLGTGEVALHDQFGNIVHLSSSGIAVTGNVTITGNLHVTGAVIGGFGGPDQVGLQTHLDPQGGPPIAGT